MSVLIPVWLLVLMVLIVALWVVGVVVGFWRVASDAVASRRWRRQRAADLERLARS